LAAQSTLTEPVGDWPHVALGPVMLGQPRSGARWPGSETATRKAKPLVPGEGLTVRSVACQRICQWDDPRRHGSGAAARSAEAGLTLG
jgi:hypothetical protein